MVKTLRYWTGRDTTLQVGDDVYGGTIIRNDNGGFRRSGRRTYHFETKDGDRIKIGRNSVVAQEGKLISKINNLVLEGARR